MKFCAFLPLLLLLGCGPVEKTTQGTTEVPGVVTAIDMELFSGGGAAAGYLLGGGSLMLGTAGGMVAASGCRVDVNIGEISFRSTLNSTATCHAMKIGDVVRVLRTTLVRDSDQRVLMVTYDIIVQ